MEGRAWVPPGTRQGLLATFNGGFKLDSAGGGFYLNGASKGSLVNGAASVVYYRDGTIKIGTWGSEVRMTPNVVGVRQNLKLIVDHGKVPATVDQNVQAKWGATLGGGYYVWRSGIGVTKDGRIIFVYGNGLIVRTLADLLRRAGRGRGPAAGHQPGMDVLRLLQGERPSRRPDPACPAARPAGQRIPVLLRL